MTKAPIALVSLELDLHVHAVANRLRERFGREAHVFAVDDYASSGELAIRYPGSTTLTDYNGDDVDLSTFGVVWWRRANQPHKEDQRFDAATRAFISAEWRYALSAAWF